MMVLLRAWWLMLCEGCWRLVRAVKKTENSVEIDENDASRRMKTYSISNGL